MVDKLQLSKAAWELWRADPRGQFAEANEADAARAQRLINSLTNQTRSRVHRLGIEGPGITQYGDLSIGESLRQFDSDTTASLTGWIDHSMSFEGWGLGLSTPRLGVGLGSLGLRGTSQVNLNMTGRTRTDLMGDGLVAVFDTKSFDTIRMVCPSENSTTAFISEYARSLGGAAGETWTGEALREYHDLILDSFENDVSYVSDRLAAVLRAPAEQRPPVRITGISIGRNAVLGCAIQIGDGDWNSLFPAGLMTLLSGEDNVLASSESRQVVGSCRMLVKWVN